MKENVISIRCDDSLIESIRKIQKKMLAESGVELTVSQVIRMAVCRCSEGWK